MLSTNLQGPLAPGIKSWTCPATAAGHDVLISSSFLSSTFSSTSYFSSSSSFYSISSSSFSYSSLIILTDLWVQTVHHTWELNYEQIPLMSGHLYIQWTWLTFLAFLSCVHWRCRQEPSGQQRHSRWWHSDRLLAHCLPSGLGPGCHGPLSVHPPQLVLTLGRAQQTYCDLSGETCRWLTLSSLYAAFPPKWTPGWG